MPASRMMPYVKRQENDTTDAEAICEAVARFDDMLRSSEG